MLMAGSGISTIGISSTTVKHPPGSLTQVGYIYLWQVPHSSPETVIHQGQENLQQSNNARGIDIFSRKTSRVCVRIIWLGPSVFDEYFGDRK